MRTVISFSLYGFVNKYIGGLLQNCRDINRIYPDFWIYVYMGNDFDRSILNGVFDSISNLKLIETGCQGHVNMTYRFFAIDDENVEIMFSRDADSRLNLRDQYCINEFLKSDKRFQIIRDHPQHRALILGGMWGIKKGLIASVKQLFVDSNRKFNSYDDDQQFLSGIMYPLIKNDALIFDEFFVFPGEIRRIIDVPYTEIYDARDHVGLPHMPVDVNDPFGEHGGWYAT
jgi:hypothetical protein